MTRLTTPLKGWDYTSAVPVSTLRADGVEFVQRYLSNDPWKNLTSSEAAALRSAGIHFSTVWEDGGTDATLGFDVGRSHAEQHLAMARGLGKRDNVGIFYFAVDYDTAGNPGATDGYFDGVASVIPQEQAGPYGDGEVILHQMARGFGGGWQALAASAWAGNQTELQAAQIIQLTATNTVDLDHAYYLTPFWDYVAPPPPDPQHYDRFMQTPVELYGHKLIEVDTVKAFDELHPHRHTHPLRYAELRHNVRLLRDRIWTVAHDHPAAAPSPAWGAPAPSWEVAWRGWRWQELDHRYNGTEA